MAAASQPKQAAALQWLGENWAAALAGIVESMAGERPSAVWRPAGLAGAPAGTGASLAWEQGFDLNPGATLWVEIPDSTWSSLGARVLGAAGVEELAADEVRATCIEMLSQSFASLAEAIGGRLDRMVASPQGREAPAQATALEAGIVEFGFSGAEPGTIRLACAPALAGPLAQPGPAQIPAAQPAEAESLAPSSATLDLLRDVELPVSVSFGRTQMALQEVLRLSAGSVIELNRSVSDPVALIVNNTVVALGEVVVVEGNYGLRVKEIMSREKLLRTSGFGVSRG